MGGRSTPLSLQEVMRRQKAQDASSSRPVFMSKSKREAWKQQVKQQEQQELLKKQALLNQKQTPFRTQGQDESQGMEHPSASHLPSTHKDEHQRDHRGEYRGDHRGDHRGEYRRGRGDQGRYRDSRDERDRGYYRNRSRSRSRSRERDKYRSRDRDRHRNRDRDRDRPRDYDRVKSSRREADHPEKNDMHKTDLEKERERELQNIKEQYLGKEKKKRKFKKPSEKFKFVFDWDASEDTSRDVNSLYQKPHEATLLFGRGYRAGEDRREQQLKAINLENDLRKKMDGASAQLIDSKEKLQRMRDRYELKSTTHWTAKALSDMTERDWRIFREDFNISYKGSKIPKPFRNWDDAATIIPQKVMQGVYDAGYQKPSPIQMAAMPIGLQQRDVIGVAETGSGKTCAFVLPMLTYISKLPPMTEANIADGPYAVVLAPTRELAQQIEEETVKFAKHMGYSVVCVVGGQSISEQGIKLRKGCEIVIATPGRLLDCLQSSYAVLNQCNYVVLDEADRMIDMGFEPQVQGILDMMPSTNMKPEDENEELKEDFVYRTTYMFSATMPPPVERLARVYLRNPVVVTIGNAGKAGANVSQQILMLKDNQKQNALEKQLEEIDSEDKTAIVFANTKNQCNYVARTLEKAGFSCSVLHGGKAQDQREHAIREFKTKKCNILVATDVAGRGIDVPDVAKVVNYDMPDNIEAYTHRIGRTGRAGKKGVAVSFVTLGDTGIYYDLVQLLRDANQSVPQELARHEAAKKKLLPGHRK